MPRPQQIRLKTQHLEAVYVVFDILESDGQTTALICSYCAQKNSKKGPSIEGHRSALGNYVEEKGEPTIKLHWTRA
jgi:hypothetical protein